MKQNSNALQEMDKLPISKAVNKNVFPAVASMLMALIYNMADKVFIGMAGNDLMVAAITMATPVFVLLISFGNVFGTGGITLISRLTGEGNSEKSRKVSSFCCWGSIGSGILVLALLLIFMSPIIKLLGASDAQTIAYTKDYLIYIAIACPFAILATTMSSLVRAEGKPTLSMIGMIIGNLINVVLDPVFILGFGMGTKGAAIATLIGQASSALFYFTCIKLGKSHLSIKLSDFSLGDHIATRVFAIGTPAALLTIFQSVSNILMNNRMSFYGDIAVAGIGAALNILTIIGIFAVGVGMGIQPLLGYQIGNRNRKKFLAILRYALIMTGCISFVLTVLCYLFTPQIIGSFVTGAEAIGYGTTFAKIILTTCWIYCLYSVCSMAMQAMDKATASMIVNLARNAYVLIPIMYLLSAIFGMNGIVWAMPISDIISIIIAILVLKYSVDKCFHTRAGKNQDQLDEEYFSPVNTSNNSKYIITIGRSYGAGGRTVGKLVAKQLNIPFYDKTIIKNTAQQCGLSQEYIDSVDETTALIGEQTIHTNPYEPTQFSCMDNTAYIAQKEVLEKIAANGSCVIIGRRADQILRKNHRVFSVFISASLSERIKRVSDRDHISPSEAKKYIQKVDKERQQYYNSLSDKPWGASETYDLSIDLTTMKPEDALQLIICALKKQPEEENNYDK